MTTTQNRSNNVRSQPISNDHHPLVRRLHALQTREGREQAGLFFIDGVRFVAQAVANGAAIETLIVSPQRLVNPLGRKLARTLPQQGVPCHTLTPDLYDRLSRAEEPQGVAAIVRQQWHTLDTIRPGRRLCWIAAEAIASSGNLGTILRTSEAVGGAGLILLGDAVDPYDPVVVRSTMGALFAQQMVRTTLAEFAVWKRRRQFTLVGTSLTADLDYHAVAYPKPVVLLMGSERKGLSEEAQALCDLRVKIPMVGRCDSLNVGIATSVMLYELFNQRRAEGR